ncbi:MAG: HU family DNA-binding protein [Clostridiaceae bacterium]|nr:HU family DNA-binding protein [Clostridiaceae bacterium]
MNKGELINSMASKSGLNKKNSEAALDAIIASIEDALKQGDKVTLVGFGTFEVRKRAARTGMNPQTKEEIKIPATKAPVFKAGKGLKDIVNN